ncbi:hypothetical protein TMEN_8743 [Trichophyton mentagrophytes]|nr:hypothetical protein TMEN_8743 [Trichophyton mentagrophytes]
MIGGADVTRCYVKGKGGEQPKLEEKEMVVNRHGQLFSTTYTYV